MAFFDELKDKAMDLGRAGVAKSRQLATGRLHFSSLREVKMQVEPHEMPSFFFLPQTLHPLGHPSGTQNHAKIKLDKEQMLQGGE